MPETEKDKQIRRLRRKIKKLQTEGATEEKITPLKTKLSLLENEDTATQKSPEPVESTNKEKPIPTTVSGRIPANVKATEAASRIVSHFREKGTAIATLQDRRINSEVRDWIPTGILPVDYVMGGGFPTGRMVEVFGLEASFKTGLGLAALDNCILMGGISILQDTENAFDRNKVRHPDSPAFIYKDDQILEEFWEYTKDALKLITGEDALTLMVWDSLPSTLPKSVFEEETGKANYGKSAKINSEAIPVAQKTVKSANCCFVINNQQRDNINPGYGEDKYNTPGGHAVRFYSSIRLQMSQRARFWYDENDKKKGLPPDGFYVEAYTKKNKLRRPFEKASFPVVFKENKGADPADAAYEFLKDRGIIEMAGGWATFQGTKFRRKEWSEMYPDLLEEIWGECEEKLAFTYSDRAKEALRLATYEIYGRPVPPGMEKEEQQEEEENPEESSEERPAEPATSE